ncbi:MAG: class I SAM-dependent methyltransferase [Acidimicrobiales bacterium]
MSATTATCPVCAGTATSELLHHSAVPTNNAILCDDPASAQGWPVGSFRLTLCHSCGFIFNADFHQHLVEYSGRIEETQAFSPHFVRYAESLARDWVDHYDIRNKSVLEVGCGKAEFLSYMCEIGDNKGIGYDPAVHLDRVAAPAASRLTLITELFGDEQIGLDADALVCRHTLEHIPAVHEFLSMLHRWAVARSTPPVILFEVPDVERVLDEVAFWDLFYEHCSYFTAETLRYAFERTGFDVLSIRRVYDGQYLVLEARPRAVSAPATRQPDCDSVAPVVALAARFVDRYRSITAMCRANLERFVSEGKTVVLWGGGAKAVSFLTSLEVGHLVEFAVDVNPNKQAKFLVGTGHAVLGPEQLRNYSSLQLVVMNPVYVPEITQAVEALGLDAQITSVNDLLGASPALG